MRKKLIAKHSLSNPKYRIITVEQPLSIASEAYRRIKVSLEFTNVDRHLQIIQICSSGQGEGKTLTALNLAATYAEDKKKTLVVDLDLRRPKIHRSFRIENKNGLTDYLAGKVSLDEAIKHSEAGIDFLNRGSKVPYPTAILGSVAMRELFDELRKMYDYIIVDAPPMLPVSDALIISKLTDCCLFVVSEEITEKSAAKEAVKTLKDNGVRVVGCVLVEVLFKSLDEREALKVVIVPYKRGMHIVASPEVLVLYSHHQLIVGRGYEVGVEFGIFDLVNPHIDAVKQASDGLTKTPCCYC